MDNACKTDTGNLVRRLQPGGSSGRKLSAASILVDTHFPGGNAIIESIAGDTIHLRPDARDSAGASFYWSIRVRGIGGKSLTFVLSEQNPVNLHGPAVSLDEGLTWQWLGNPDGSMDSFRCAFPQKVPSIRLAFCIGYLDQHWQRFCGRIAKYRTFIREEILCLSRKGRAVPRLHVGRVDGKAKHRVLLTARHHACETMANYVLEGIVLATLTDDEIGNWYRENVELVVLPFMDRDGVEDGDSGIYRRPHDHSRDYLEESLYPETRALREFVMRWASQSLEFMADLHSPWIRGDAHEQIYQVTRTDLAQWAIQRQFAEILTTTIRGPLPFSNAENQNFGHDWQTPADPSACSSPVDWFAKHPNIKLATSFEIPFANCSGVAVTVDGCRAFGRDMAHAIQRYIAENADTAAFEGVPLAKIYVDAANPDPKVPLLRPTPAVGKPPATVDIPHKHSSPPGTRMVKPKTNSPTHIVIYKERLKDRIAAARAAQKRLKPG